MAPADVTGPAAGGRDRSLSMAALLAAVGFVLMIGVELAIYEKGILRALWVSAVSAIVIFAIVFFAMRAAARTQSGAESPGAAD